jgi:hypothetical protein
MVGRLRGLALSAGGRRHPPALSCTPTIPGPSLTMRVTWQQVLDTIAAHDASTPLFLFWAPHIVHTPLQLPQPFIDKFDFIADTDKPTHVCTNRRSTPTFGYSPQRTPRGAPPL